MVADSSASSCHPGRRQWSLAIRPRRNRMVFSTWMISSTLSIQLERYGSIRRCRSSIVALGADAAEFTSTHLRGRAVGLGSPLDLLAQRGGRVLLLGVAHTANTTVHVGEDHAGVPKPAAATASAAARVRLPDGEVLEHLLDPSP